MAVKKNMLSEYVNNMIIYIDGERKAFLENNPDATEEDAEKEMSRLARKRIYEEQHSDGAYMWIQKVLDYNGGDDYAIRLIHPNLSDTEGSLLSTNTVNEMGMKAYEIELEGVKKDGEIYQNYAFKKLNSDEVTEKVTYAKLYEPFDWIICMGVNLDDIEHYRLQAQEHMRSYQSIVITAVALIWLMMLFFMLYFYRRAKNMEFEKKHQELSSKLNWDTLTGANSRTYGERLLKEEYESFTGGKKDTVILMMDVDYFKQFNDGYGHELGDNVLKSFVGAVKACTRSSDTVIRWGGDEFVVVLQNIPRDILPSIADKILNSVRGISIDGLSEDQKITSSMGFAYFESSDENYKATLARADEALYKAKESGRNNWKISD
jgi:diguanylate cyclase (GGDEF)-like protein